jgi:hypothetical protein
MRNRYSNKIVLKILAPKIFNNKMTIKNKIFHLLQRIILSCRINKILILNIFNQIYILIRIWDKDKCKMDFYLKQIPKNIFRDNNSNRNNFNRIIIFYKEEIQIFPRGKKM